MTPSFLGDAQHRTSDAQLRIGGISRFSDVQLHIVVRFAPRNDGESYGRFAMPSINRSMIAAAVRSASAPSTPQRGKWLSIFIRAKP